MLCSNFSPRLLDQSSKWYVSEKYDGWRMTYRDGAFWTRSGNVIKPPKYIRKALAAVIGNEKEGVELDGELWLGYGRFQDIPAALEMRESGFQWILFDMPSANGSYAKRYRALKALFCGCGDTGPIRVIEHLRARSAYEAEEAYVHIMRKSPEAEGVVYRPKGLEYTWGARDPLFMKRKPWQDLEATVVGYHVTKPMRVERPDGYVSSLICEMPSGAHFRVSFKGAGAPVVGSLVTVAYQNLTDDGVPRFPVLKGVRNPLDAPLDAVSVGKTALKKKAKTAAVQKVVLPTKARVVQTLAELADVRLKPREQVYIPASGKSVGYYCITQPRDMGALPYCTCAAWKYQRLPPCYRTCKHINALLKI